MARLRQLSSFRVALVSALVVFGLIVGTSFAAEVTTPFAGKAVNGGTVTHEMQGGKHRLTVSADFQVPGSPDPHWQGRRQQRERVPTHTNAEMVYRRYHRFIPNLCGRDGALTAKGLADEGL